MFQGLKIVASYLYFALCVALIACWVRRYGSFGTLDLWLSADRELLVRQWQGDVVYILTKTEKSNTRAFLEP